MEELVTSISMYCAGRLQKSGRHLDQFQTDDACTVFILGYLDAPTTSPKEVVVVSSQFILAAEDHLYREIHPTLVTTTRWCDL